MKKIYLCLTLLLISAFVKKETFAGHIQGAEIGYSCVAPNVYNVTLRVYRDCMAISLPNTLTLNMKAGSCNNGRNVTVNKVGLPRIGNPYCTTQPVTCSMSGLPTFEELTYTATVTFSAAEAQCSDWTFSFSDCFRAPSSGNIANANTTCFYVDSFLKLSPSINNNSPEFSMLDMLNIAWNEKVTYSTYARDADGDSLVYSLKPALSAANTPVTYLPGLSGTNPIASAPAIQIDQHNGSITLIPTTPPIPGSNNYSIVVQVDEYRYINGVATRVGSAKRDMIVAVVNSQVGSVSNVNPYTTNVKVNGQPVAPNTIINATAGVPLTFEVEGFDPNQNDVLSMSSDANVVLPGAAFNVAGIPVKGTLTWTPTAGHVRRNLYYFRVNLKDNFCLTRGIHNQTFALRVSNPQNPTGTKASVDANYGFSAYPNPFNRELHFKFQAKAESLIIYNLLGQEIDRISVENNGPGEQRLQWKSAGNFAAGTYVAKLTLKDKTVQALKFTKIQ